MHQGCTEVAPGCTRDATGLQQGLHQSHIRDALELHQGCIRVALELHQGCIRDALELQQDCTRLALGMQQGCTRIPSGMHWNCTRDAPGLHQRCTGVAPGLQQRCIRVAPGLHQSRIRDAPEMHQGCTYEHNLSPNPPSPLLPSSQPPPNQEGQEVAAHPFPFAAVVPFWVSSPPPSPPPNKRNNPWLCFALQQHRRGFGEQRFGHRHPLQAGRRPEVLPL